MAVFHLRRRTVTTAALPPLDRKGAFAAIEATKAKRTREAPALAEALRLADTELAKVETAAAVMRDKRAAAHTAQANASFYAERDIQAAEAVLRSTASPLIAGTVKALWQRFDEIRNGPITNGLVVTGHDYNNRQIFARDPSVVTTDEIVDGIRRAIPKVEALLYADLTDQQVADGIEAILEEIPNQHGRRVLEAAE
jgi:hypothetical protein